MFDMNKLFADALKPASIGEALEICTMGLTRRGVDKMLADTIVEDILNFSQFRVFRFEPKDFDQIMEGKARIHDLLQSRLTGLIPFFQNQAKIVCALTNAEAEKMGEMLKISLDVFLEDPEFLQGVQGVTNKIIPLLKELRSRREDG